jgi:large exoprotein involved in heme utilization and adhesion
MPALDGSCVASGNAGLVAITGDQVLIDGGRITSTTAGVGDAGIIGLSGSTLVMTGGEIATRALEGSSGSAGLVGIDARNVVLADGAVVTSDTAGTGDAGGVLVRGTDVLVTGEARLSSSTTSAGAAGFVRVETTNLTVSERASVLSGTVGAGNAGIVSIVAQDAVVVDTGGRVATSAGEGSSGNAGQVEIRALRLEVFGGGRVASDTFSIGDAGNVSVFADDILVAAGGSISSDSLLQCPAQACVQGDRLGGDAGEVTIEAKRVALIGNPDMLTLISSDTFGAGEAGDVRVAATESLLIADGAILSSDTFGDGNSGSITVDAGALTVDGGQISSSAFQGSRGLGGEIAVTAGRIAVLGGGEIVSQAFSVGNAGNVHLTADQVQISGTSGDAFSRVSSSTFGEGAAGGVLIEVAELDLSDGGAITSSSAACPDGSCLASGDAGLVSIVGERINISDGVIRSTTAGVGDAGVIGIAANSLTMSGGEIATRALEGSSGISGLVGLDVGRIALSRGAVVTSDTGGTGDAGGVLVRADQLLVTDGARLSSSTTSDGAAGFVEITAGALVVSDRGSVLSETTGKGDAGLIRIVAQDSIVVDRGRIATSAAEFSEGNAGEIDILARSLSVLNEGRVVSDTDSTGNAGGVTVVADRILVASGSRLSSDSLLQCFEQVCVAGERLGGNAGKVSLQAREISLIGAEGVTTFISSDTFGAGRAGRCERNRERTPFVANAGISFVRHLWRRRGRIDQGPGTSGRHCRRTDLLQCLSGLARRWRLDPDRCGRDHRAGWRRDRQPGFLLRECRQCPPRHRPVAGIRRRQQHLLLHLRRGRCRRGAHRCPPDRTGRWRRDFSSSRPARTRAASFPAMRAASP